jgi:hemolysin-activating ACP:hemolysin acyltransferase
MAWELTPYSMSSIGGKPTENQTRRVSTIGFVFDMASTSVSHMHLPVTALMRQVNIAISTEQIKVYFNNYGECMGYVVWALLAPDVESRFFNGDLSLQLVEWNEGTSLWIIDFLVPRGSLKYVLRDLRDDVFKDHSTVTYFRVKRGKLITKQMGRNDGGNFFKSKS